VKKNLLLAFIALVFVASCTKLTNTEIGNGLIPPIDGIETKDTLLNVITRNFPLDSIRISKFQEMVLGNIDNDPIMGTTKAIINAEFKPLYYPYFYEVGKDSLFLDSAVLVLGYRGYWGDSANPIHLKVYEISQTSRLKQDSVYTSNSQMNLAGQIGEVTIADPRKLTDSVKPRKEAAINQIRIPLSTAFANRLLFNFDSSNAYRTDAQFSSIFRGFSIVPQAGSNTLLRVSLSDTNSKVALYYRYTRRDSIIDTVVRYFRHGVTSNASNNIIRNRAGSQAQTFLTNPATQADSLLFLQAGPGNFIRIETPALENNISNRLVHRAELIMEQEADNDPFYEKYSAPNLFLCAVPKRLDSAQFRFYVPNDISLGQGGVAANLNSFGGNVVYKTDPTGKRIASYAFNITRYVQGIITRKEKVYDLYLFAPVEDYVHIAQNSTSLYPIAAAPFNYPASGRVRLLGGNSARPDRKMRLRIIFSRL
jgi:hypothetical protein